MLDGWYCRSMANQQSSNDPNEPDDDLEVSTGDGTNAADAGQMGDGGGDSGSEEDESQAVTMSHNAFNQRIDYRAQYSGLKKKLKFLLYV